MGFYTVHLFPLMIYVRDGIYVEKNPALTLRRAGVEREFKSGNLHQQYMSLQLQLH